MKRRTPLLRLREWRLARTRALNKKRRKGKRRVLQSNRYVRPSQIIRAPRRFDLTRGSGIEVVKFLRALSASTLNHRLAVTVDFRFTESFAVPAALLLLAEVNRIMSESELPKPITILDPRLRRPREVLKQIGLYELTHDKCDVVPLRDDVVYWRATKGATQSGDDLQLLEVVADRVNQHHANQIAVGGLWRGVSEAVANTVDHAYRKARYDGFGGLADTKWWMFTQLRDDVFTVAVCDLGCGYRETIGLTLPEHFRASVANGLAGWNRDSIAIHTAMEYGRSGTNEGHRGRGSRDALSVLENHQRGQLVILSNAGWMKYTKNEREPLSREAGRLGIDIGGTVVWWNLPLKESGDGDR